MIDQSTDIANFVVPAHYTHGKSVLELGYYDPLNKIVNFDKIQLQKYLNCGAYPTDTVRHLISQMIENTNI